MKKFINNILESELREFTPIPFWFLNDELNEDELCRQLEDFNEKGVNGVVLHPRMGLSEKIDYLSDTYFKIIEKIVIKAKELDMKIVLYDEASYPSGSAHGEVVKYNKEFASEGIKISDNYNTGRIIAKLGENKFLVAQKTGGTIRGLYKNEDDGEVNAPLSADILNPSAVDIFIKITHEAYYSKLKQYFGNTIIGFFTDEPCVTGRNSSGFKAWTDGMEKLIIKEGGDLKELEGLFCNEENKTTAIYKKILKKLLINNYYKKLSKWCIEHEVLLMGHPEKGDDIDEEEFFGVPGQDLIFRFVSPENGGIDGKESVQAKCSSDTARHLKKRRNLNECFGVCSRNGIPWYMTASDMKWFIDWLGVRGVNMFVPHAFFYSIHGDRLMERPPDVGPHNIWWKYYRYFSNYMKRISYLMTDSKNCADIAVICESGKMPAEEVKYLYQNQIEFNYLSVTLFNTAKIENGLVKIGEYQYNTILDFNHLINDNKIKNLVNYIDDVQKIRKNDFITGSPCPDLRVSHIVKNGIDMYYVFNEGANQICTPVKVLAKGEPVFVNLWDGKYFKVSSELSEFMLNLNPYEAVMIIMDTEKTNIEFREELNVVAQNNDFVKTFDDGEKREYEFIYSISEFPPNPVIKVRAQEMVECYCNGRFVGVGFFDTHTFEVGKYLTKGKNNIKLIITGNAANKYCKAEVCYGLCD